MAARAVCRDGGGIHLHGVAAAHQGAHRKAYRGRVHRQTAAASARAVLVSAHAHRLLPYILWCKPPSPARRGGRRGVPDGRGVLRRRQAAGHRVAPQCHVLHGRGDGEDVRRAVHTGVQPYPAGRRSVGVVLHRPKASTVPPCKASR